MADLIISRVALGAAAVTSTDPFDQFSIHRIDRSAWKEAPAQPGVYMLHGLTEDGRLVVYIGMSTTDMRERIRSHHVNKKKNWFGVLFAVPIDNPAICPAVESELIARVNEAGVVDVVANQNPEERHLNSGDVHVEPAIEKIKDALALLLGTDIFTPLDQEEDRGTIGPRVEKMEPLAREYRGGAEGFHTRGANDPAEATHVSVRIKMNSPAWGYFEGDDPDKRFHVLAGSGWNSAPPREGMATEASQSRITARQKELVNQGVLDENTMRFAQDYVFNNWSTAALIVSGMTGYSGAYHWQCIQS